MKRYFTYLFIIIASHIFAQVNLVPNPSFEEKEYCPNGDVYKATGWFSPTSNTPDIYRDSGNTGACYENCDWVGIVPYGYNGTSQSPRTGVAFTGMITLTTPSGAREYISIQLTDSLQAGKKYCVSFYTYLSANSGLAFDKIGVYFSVLSPLDCVGDQIISNNGISNQAGDVILDTLNWVLVSDTFVATGGERFLTLGNFQNYSDLQIDSTGYPQAIIWSYHLFDDISVIYCDSIIVEPPPPPFYPEITLFPNPTNGEFSVTGNFSAGTQLSIYNMLGQKIGESIVLPEGNNILSINLELAQGAYYYEFRSPIEQVAEGKFIIIE